MNATLNATATHANTTHALVTRGGAAAASVHKTLASGRIVDLMRLTPAEVDFTGDIAPMLAHIARFDGAALRHGRAWTVLDHLVIGHDLLPPGASARLRALWLLHDAHEAYLGDITAPAERFLAAMADTAFEKPGHSAGFIVREAVRAAKSALDAPILAAAGLEPPTPEERQFIGLHDARMLISERNQLLADAPDRARFAAAWRNLAHVRPLRMTGSLCPQKPGPAIAAWLTRLAAAAPATRPATTPDALEALAAHRTTRTAR